MGRKLAPSSKARRGRNSPSTNPMKKVKKPSNPLSQGRGSYLKKAAPSSRDISEKKIVSQIANHQEACSSSVGGYSLRKRDTSVSYAEDDDFSRKTTKTANTSTHKTEKNSTALNSQNGNKTAKTRKTPKLQQTPKISKTPENEAPSELRHGYALRSRGPVPQAVSVTPKKKPGPSKLVPIKFEERMEVDNASTCSRGRNQREEIDVDSEMNVTSFSQQSMEITHTFKRSVRPRITNNATVIAPIKHSVSRKSNSESQLSISQHEDEASLSENEDSESNSSVEHSVLDGSNANGEPSSVKVELSLSDETDEESQSSEQDVQDAILDLTGPENQSSSNKCEGERSMLDKSDPESQIGSSDEEGDSSVSSQTECHASLKEKERVRLNSDLTFQSRISQQQNGRLILEQTNRETESSSNESEGEHSVLNRTNHESQLGSSDEESDQSFSFQTKCQANSKEPSQSEVKEQKRGSSILSQTFVKNQTVNNQPMSLRSGPENQAVSQQRKREVSILSQTFIKPQYCRGKRRNDSPLQDKNDPETESNTNKYDSEDSLQEKTNPESDIGTGDEDARILSSQSEVKEQTRGRSILGQTFIKTQAGESGLENQADLKQRKQELSILSRTFIKDRGEDKLSPPLQSGLKNQSGLERQKRKFSILDKTYCINQREDELSLQTDIEVQACSWVSGESYFTNQSSLSKRQDKSSLSDQVDPIDLSKEPEDTANDENVIDLCNISAADARYVVTACESFQTETNESRVTTPNDFLELGRSSILKTSGSRKTSVKKLVKFHEDIIERETMTPNSANTKDKRSPMPLTPRPFGARTNLTSPNDSAGMDKTPRKNNDSVFKHLQRQGNWIPGKKLSVSPLLGTASPISFKKSPLTVGQGNVVEREVADSLQERRTGCKPRKQRVPENVVNIRDMGEPDGSESTQEYSELLNVKSNAYILGMSPFKGPRPVIIDGCSVAFSHGLSIRGRRVFSCRGVAICVNFFKQRGHKVVAFVPETFRHRSDISNLEILERLAKQKHLKFTTSREMSSQLMVDDRWYDQRFIVQCAASLRGVIVSNEKYRDLLNENPAWKSAIGNRMLKFTFVGDDILFRQDPLRARGLEMDQILHFPK